jgi:hypothetical protein
VTATLTVAAGAAAGRPFFIFVGVVISTTIYGPYGAYIAECFPQPGSLQVYFVLNWQRYLSRFVANHTPVVGDLNRLRMNAPASLIRVSTPPNAFPSVL